MITSTLNSEVAVSEKSTLRALRRAVIARGARYCDVKELGADELVELLTTGRSIIENPDEVVARYMEARSAKKAYHSVLHIEGAVDLLKQWGKIELAEKHEVVLDEVLAMLVQKKLEKLVDREGRLAIRSENRSMYLSAVTMVATQFHDRKTDEIRLRWRHDEDLISTGVLPRLLEALGEESGGAPWMLRIENELPLDEKGRQLPIPKEMFDALWEQGYLVTASTGGDGWIAWLWKGKLREILLACFPKAINMSAYNHRLSSPVIPGGWFEGVSVTFRNPTAWSNEPDGLVEATKAAMAEIEGDRAWFERDQECDGSGLYNPNHPLMADLIQRYGKSVFQITLLRPDGLFAKGIIVPREGLADEESIVMDMAQVKGSFSGILEENDVAENCYIGLMKAWTKEAYYPGNFELLQFVEIPQDPTEKEELKQATISLIRKNMNKVLAGGPDKLMSEMVKSDQGLKITVKVISQIRANDVEMNPMSIPMVADAMEDMLSAKLWISANGAGIRGRQYVTVLDATVAPGTCVLRGFKKGQTVAVWRFPNVLAQGLCTLTPVAPSPHQVVDEQVIANTIFLNPHDLVLCMQGDDDGDIVGVSSDPDVLKLFSHTYKVGPFKVENKAEKFEMTTDSEPGRQWVMRDNRGPVGLTTNWQSELLAAGDMWGAIALACLNQEAIDSAKKAFIWTNVQFACNPNNWYEKDGVWHLKEGYKGAYAPGDEFPKDDIAGWVRTRLTAKGYNFNKPLHLQPRPCAWRRQQAIVNDGFKDLKKRISRKNFLKCAAKDNGAPGRNMVHFTHDQTWNEYFHHEAMWDECFAKKEEIPNRELMFKLAALRGVTLTLTASTFEDYLELQARSGLKAHGDEFKKLMSKKDKSFDAIELANNRLYARMAECSVADLATIWYWEMTPMWSYQEGGRGQKLYSETKPSEGQSWECTKKNRAIRAISWPGSPMLPLLGIEDEGACSFLVKRGDALVQEFMKAQNPFQEMSRRAFANTSHGKLIVKDGKPLEFHQCKHCMDGLATRLIVAWRKSKNSGESEYAKGLTSRLNKTDYQWSQGTPEYDSYFGEYEREGY